MNRTETTQSQPTDSHTFLKIILRCLCIIILTGSAWQVVLAATGSFPAAQGSAHPGLEVNLRAASGATIPFTTSNSSVTPGKDIPYLVLSRNNMLTDSSERTLTVTVEFLKALPGESTITLRLETQHGDPDRGGSEQDRITVWQEHQQVKGNRGGSSTSFTVVFGELIPLGGQLIPTPTDYYRLSVIVQDENYPDFQPLYAANLEYALLLERQWLADLEHAQPVSASNPHQLLLYACDMFPFQRDAHDPASRITRIAIPGYIQSELLPEMLAAIHLQTAGWGFDWEGWVSYASNGDPNTLEVALSDGATWYHGPAPERGNASIAINVNGGNNAEYDTLADGVLSTFHHELFHNLQLAIANSSGGHLDIDGMEDAWQFFSEGMAAFVPTVAQPQVQFSQSRQPRAYIAKAIQFIGGKGHPGELNTSYAALNPYHAALYWRFLYEQCGGFSNGAENPTGGMRLLRRTLQALYGAEVVDINHSTDLVAALPQVMNHVLAGSDAEGCPFTTYEASLAHFARSIYTLRLADGRCTAPGIPTNCGFYDPESLYSEPRVVEISFTGEPLVYSSAQQPYPNGIQSSYGMDFIDLKLRPAESGQELTIQVAGLHRSTAEFNVQILKLHKRVSGGMSVQKAVVVAPVEFLQKEIPDSPLTITISASALQNCNRIGIIITRVDAGESIASNGAYTLLIHK
jgi:hypothetical protein